VLSPSDVTIGRKAVLSMLLCHEKGVLSRILNLLTSFSANILTITQSLPINEKASVTISLDVADMSMPIRELIGVIENTGVAENVKLEAIE
jgi:chorismate mutase